MLVANGGNDVLIGQAGVDNFSAGDGNDTNFARDGVAETISCGTGTDGVTADAIDTPAADCENVSLP